MADHQVVVYGCENSGYPAAVSALASQTNEPPGRRIDLLRIPCSGRIEVGLLLDALERGADGVLVLGCPADSCKYLSGNLRAEKRVSRARRALRDAGIQGDRVRIELLSSLDSHKVAQLLADMEQRLATGQPSRVVAAGGGNQA